MKIKLVFMTVFISFLAISTQAQKYGGQKRLKSEELIRVSNCAFDNDPEYSVIFVYKAVATYELTYEQTVKWPGDSELEVRERKTTVERVIASGVSGDIVRAEKLCNMKRNEFLFINNTNPK